MWKVRRELAVFKILGALACAGLAVYWYLDGDTRVIRAELPGVDPAKDVEVTVTDGLLRIDAERRVESKSEDRGFLRHELGYGSYSRTLPLPEGVRQDDIAASCMDGILEIRIPNPPAPPAGREPKRIAIATD